MWQVHWLQEALDDLTRIWTAADSQRRKEITQATHALDQELQTDPLANSESRDEGERALFVYPLGAQIEVDLEQRMVWVLHVWRFRRRGER